MFKVYVVRAFPAKDIWLFFTWFDLMLLWSDFSVSTFQIIAFMVLSIIAAVMTMFVIGFASGGIGEVQDDYYSGNQYYHGLYWYTNNDDSVSFDLIFKCLIPRNRLLITKCWDLIAFICRKRPRLRCTPWCWFWLSLSWLSPSGHLPSAVTLLAAAGIIEG